MTRNPVFYADSADTEEVAALLAAGVITGVTTNPTILARSNRGASDIPELARRWSAEGAERVFFQAWGSTAAELIERGTEIASLGSNITVKVPATTIGFTAARALIAQDVSVLITAVYAPAQALLAAAIGADFIAPYLGRLEDSGQDGVAVIADFAALVADSDTEVLAASLRTPDAIAALARVGVWQFTAAPGVIWACMQNDVSDASAAAFESDMG
ncbi:transaldolase family protein [Mycetocola tolaasinivorans]|nr:transaldolase family protein [Mycetocola tolaasinivorans]